jgi:hypothetical protein
MNGPFKAGQDDKKIFGEKGLKQKLKSLGKRRIGDGGYGGHPDELSIVYFFYSTNSYFCTPTRSKIAIVFWSSGLLTAGTVDTRTYDKVQLQPS